MNQLSWLLYVADALPSLGNLMFFVGVAIIIYIGVRWLVYGCLLDSSDVKYKRVDPPAKPKTNGFLCLTFCLFIIATLIPSKDTMYAIAASQVGEAALKTPLAQKAEQALESWLDKQTKSNEKPSS